MIKIKEIVSSICLFFLLLNPVLAQSTAAILPQGKTQFLDNNGNPLSAGKVFFYIPSTTTFKTTWQDAAETIANTNPVVLDAGGRAIIYGAGTYRQIVKASNGNTVYDAVTASAGSGGGTTGTGDGDLVGTIKPWAGLVAPNQYVFAYGQEISRITYAAFFTAVTLNQPINCTSGSPILTGLTDTSQLAEGALIEATCMPAGSAIFTKTSTTVTMNTNASLTVATTGTFFLYGNGNGSTTFNVPDLRGQTIAGRTNMGGTASTNLTATYFNTPFGQSPNATGAKGGLEYSQLATSNLPPYTPAGTPSHTPMGTINTPTITTTLSAAATNNINNGTGGGANLTGGGGALNQATITASSSSSPLTFSGTTTAGSFVGTAQGGTSARFPLIQPTITLNYIIKITPDQNSADASGVTSLGLMTGDIACGSGLLCTGNVISTTGVDQWATSINDIHNTNTGSVLIGTSTGGSSKLIVTDDVSATNIVLDVHSKNAVYSMAEGAPTQFMKIYSGSAANPITTATPTVSISRREALTVDSSGAQNAALWAENLGNNTSGPGVVAQPNAITGFATQLGSGDTVGVYANSQQNGSVVGGTSYAAFGAVGQASALKSGTSAIGLAAATENNTGTNQLYAGSTLGRGHPNTIGVDVAAFGAFRQTVGLYVHTNSSVGWDVGLAFDTVGGVTGTVTADIQDNTSAVSILLDQGTHTNGIDLRAGTYSGSPFISTGFNVDSTGNMSAKALSHTSSIFIGSTSGQTTLNASAVAGVTTLVLPAANDTLVGKATTDILTNKSISGSTNTLTNIGNSSLTNSSTTVNGQTCTLGSTCTITASATAVTIGSTTVGSGTTGRPLYDNAGVLGEYATIPVAFGGTNCTAASGTCLDNITGFASTGFITRTGAGAFAFQSTTNGITLGNMAQALSNSVLANCTGSTANITNVQAGANDQVFRVAGGGGGTCSWGAVNLASTNAVTGTLPVANGGTGDTGTAWTTYTPTLSCGSGTLTTASATGAYKQLGKTVFVRIVGSITTNGTCASVFLATLPIAVSVGLGDQSLTAFNGSTAAVLAATISPAASTTTARFFTATGTYPGANGTEIIGQGVYEVP